MSVEIKIKPSKKAIEYFFDFQSPYSYLSWARLKKENIFERADFSFFPVNLAYIIHSYETKGPGEIPTKRNYLFKECLRFAALNGIAFRPPKTLPFNSLYALRLSLLEIAGPGQFMAIDKIFRAGWEEGEDIGSPEVLLKLLAQLNLPAQEMMDKVLDRVGRLGLKKNNQLALERGVFGVPTMLVEDELFWGNDSIPAMSLYLQNKDPLNREAYDLFIKNYNFGD